MATELAIATKKTQKFFDELERQRTIVSSCTQLFTTLTTHFASLQNSLSQRSQSLDSKFQSLESDSQKTLESLSLREDSIPERESAAVAKIDEQRERALSEFEKPPKRENLSDSLKSVSRRMDYSRLVKLVLSKRKESISLRAELPRAIVEAVDPARLILDAVDDYVSNKIGKVGLTDKRWACGTLVQALFPEGTQFGGKKENGPEFSTSMVERAAGILERWKKDLVVEEEEDDGAGAGAGGRVGGVVGPAEAVMFLHMVVGFRLKSRFDEEFLKKLVMEHATRRDMAKLAAALEFGEKLGDMIEELVNNGKEIEAVYFASESGLTEKFPPFSLVKSYLKNSKKKATNILKGGNYSAAAKEESSTVELSSIRAIIRCVEDHKLEAEFPLDSLRTRATQLEKTKAEKKKSSGAPAAAKPQNKRGHGSSSGRAGGGPEFRPGKAPKYSNVYSPFSRRNPALPAQHSPTTRFSGPYSYPSQSGYEAHTPTAYAPAYGVSHTQSPAAIPQQHYSLPVDNMSAGGYRASGSYGVQTNYGAYDYGSGAPPNYQPSS